MQKKWRPIIGFFMLFYCFLPFSQGQYSENVDSLIEELQHKTKKKEKKEEIELLNELAFQFNKDENKSEEYAKKALQLSKDSGYSKGEGDAYIRLGIIAKNRGQYELSKENYFKALEIREKIKIKEPIVATYNNLGILFKQQGQFTLALNYFEKGLQNIDITVGDAEKAKILNGMAACYQHLGEYQRALELNDKVIEIREKLNDTIDKAKALITAGNIYQKLRNFTSGEAKYKESLSIFEMMNYDEGQAKSFINLGNIYYEQKELEKGLKCYQKAMRLKDALPEDDLAILYRNIGACYAELEKPDSALIFYNESKEIYQANQNNFGLSDIESSFGSLYLKLKQYPKALKHLTESLNIFKKNELSDPILKLHILKALSDAYSESGDLSAAFKFESQYSFLQDSISELSMNAANYKYSYEEERRENENLINQSRIQYLQKMQLIYVFIGVIILFIFAAGIAYMAIQQQQRKRKMDREIDDLLWQQEITTSYARIEGQDEERYRIAQDLHDRLGSMLSTIKLYFSAIETKIDLVRLENREQFSKANQLLDDAFDEVRRVAHDMHSGVLKNFGLKAQLEELTGTINNTKQIKIELLVHKFYDRIEFKLEVNIYRIIQELLGNTLKHSKATKLSIQLSRFEDIIHILVEDNGVGFKEDAALEKGGIGLSGVQTRVKALNGSINIDSTIGRGTSIAIDIPYQHKGVLLENNKI